MILPRKQPYLVEVPAGRGWVGERQLQLLVRANDVHRADSHREALPVQVVRVQHAQRGG